MEELITQKLLQEKIAKLEKELSDLKQSQSYFNVNHQLFFEICEHSKNAITLFETTDNGNTFIIKYFNRKAEEIEGVNRDNITGMSLVRIFPGIKKSGFFEALQRVYRSGEPENFPAILFSSNKIIEWKQNYIYKLSNNEVVSIYLDETEYKTREYELHENREKLKLAMEAARFYSFEINLKTGKITTNKALYESLGYNGSEILQLMKKAGSLIDPEDFKKAKEALFEHQASLSAAFKYEFRIKNKVGKLIWFSVHGKVIEWDKYSNPERFVGLIQNVQNEKEILFKLQESEEKFKSLATLLPEVIYETDLQGNITFVNLKAFDIFEYTAEDFKKGLNITQMLAPEELVRAKSNIEQLLMNGNVAGEEYIALKKSGKRFPILVYSSVIKEAGISKGLRGIIINITEQNKIRDKLKSSQEIFTQLSGNISDAFWLRSLDNRVLYANPACYTIVGDNFEQIFEDFSLYEQWIHPEDRERIIRTRQKNSKSPDQIHFYEHRIINHGGEVKWLWIRTFPVFDSEGKLYRRAGIASDITDQKNLIADLLAAKEKAEESDRLKSAFLANMSHEIRTPMNGILGFSELLQDEHITEAEKKTYLRIIDSNGKQLLNLINDIIDIAKIEAGQITLNKKVIDVNSFLEDIFNQYNEEQKSFSKNNIHFTLRTPDKSNTLLFTDAARLRQIFCNLLSNAFKFTEQGEISMGYEIISEHDAHYFRFFVMDTGTGIPEDKKNYIFKRFIQLKPQKQKNYQGTGLGLSISQGLTELLKGKIWVESVKENKKAGIPGFSKFYFTVPVDTMNTTKVDESEIIKESSPMKKFERMQILIVEDDSDNMALLSKLLQKFGATVITAATGEEAIMAVQNNPQIKIVLMDIRLPDMDGFEATKKIKEMKPHLPVIAQTAYAMYNDREECLQQGCDDYISKPLNKDVLFEKINHYIYA